LDTAASALARTSIKTVHRYLYIRVAKAKCFALAARNLQALVLTELEGRTPDSLSVEPGVPLLTAPWTCYRY